MKSTNSQKPEIQLMDSVGEEKSFELITDILEVGFDKITDSALLKDLPVFGGFIKVYKAFYSVKEQLFLKKISKFLFELRDIPQYKRLAFVNELDKDNKKEEVGETLLIILDKLDHMEKPMILGRLLKAQIEGHIDLNKFLRLSYAVNKVFIQDLHKLKNYMDKPIYEENTSEELLNVGMINNPNSGKLGITYPNERVVVKYSITTLGSDLLKYGLSE